MELSSLSPILICLVAFFSSALTFLSGFGLGTILLPAFALFFPIEIAVAFTAIVHFLNNLFKLGLVGRHARLPVVLWFGIPAILSALVGANLLVWLAGFQPLWQYQLGGHILQVEPVKLIISILIMFFAIFEIMPSWEGFSLNKRFLPVGGILSGFFGGLSGHQGALRSAFLLRAGLSKESFIGTGVVIACLIDISRLSIYGARILASVAGENILLLIFATGSAFIGALLGNLFLKKISLRGVQIVVSIMLFGVALGLGMGVL